MLGKVLAALAAILTGAFAMGAGCRDDSDPLPRATADPVTPPATPEPTPPPGPDPGPIVPPGLGWVVQTSGTLAPIESLAVVNANTVFAAASGNILRTLDGGVTWTQASGGDFTRVVFLDAMNGWAITDQQILSTVDGGTTWTVRKTALENPFTSLSFISHSAGWVTTRYNEVFRTIDGGQTWDLFTVAAPPAFPIHNIRVLDFVDGATGFLAATDPETGGQAIFRTTNGGITWEKMFAVGINEITDLEAVDSQRIFAVGSLTAGGTGEVILASNDGGATFTEQHMSGPGSLSAVTFVNPLVGFAVGNRVLATTNGGLTWSPQQVPVDQTRFLDVAFASPSTGWLVGTDGTILTTTTGGQ